MQSTSLPPELTDQSIEENNIEENNVTDSDSDYESINESDRHGNGKRPLVTAFKCFFVVSNITLMAFVAYTVIRPEDDRFKAIEDKVTVNTSSINEVAGSVKTNSELSSQFESSITNLKSYIDERSGSNAGKITLSSERVDMIELRLLAIEKQWTAMKESQAQKKQIAKSKPSTPRRAVIQPMSLVSIRSQGDYGMVNLASTKGEISPLLRNGDEWNGWKFIRLDGRSAIFEVAGRERQLAL